MTLAEQIAAATNLTDALIIKASAIEDDIGASYVAVLEQIQTEGLSKMNRMLHNAIDMKLREYNEQLGLDAEPIFIS